MLKFLTIVLSLFCFHQAFAQQDYFEKGFVILLSGDTVQGEVQRLRDNRLTEKVLFKTNGENQNGTTYKPFEIKGFGTTKDGLYFESVEYVNRSPNSSQTYQRFAKQLIDGYTSLYRLEMTEEEFAAKNNKMPDLDHVYILKKDADWYTLDQYVIHNQEQNIDLMQTRYIGMLKLAMQDCPRIQAGMEDAKFNDSNMSAVVVNYNKCRYPDSSVIVKRMKTKTKWRFGANISAVYLLKNKYNTHDFGGAFGLFAQRFNQGENENINFSFGLEYLYMDFRYNDSKVQYDLNMLRIPVRVNYYLSQKSVKPYIQTGITASSKLFLINAGAGLEFNRYAVQLCIETLPLRTASPKLLSLRLGVFL